MAIIEKDFAELLRCFNNAGVRYCIVGAFAVGFHAVPRYTKDMDLLVEPTRSNGKKICRALKAFGFGALAITPEDFNRPGRFIQLGYEPVRVDLITSLPGVTFTQVWKARQRGAYGGEPVWFIGREELAHSKRAAGRLQDLADLDMLRKTRTRRRVKGGKGT